MQPIEVSKRMFRLPTEKAVFKKRRSAGYTPALPERAFKKSYAAEMPHNRGKNMVRVGFALGGVRENSATKLESLCRHLAGGIFDWQKYV